MYLAHHCPPACMVDRSLHPMITFALNERESNGLGILAREPTIRTRLDRSIALAALASPLHCAIKWVLYITYNNKTEFKSPIEFKRSDPVRYLRYCRRALFLASSTMSEILIKKIFRSFPAASARALRKHQAIMSMHDKITHLVKYDFKWLLLLHFAVVAAAVSAFRTPSDGRALFTDFYVIY